MKRLLTSKNVAVFIAFVVAFNAGYAYAFWEICEKGMRLFSAGEYGAALSPLEECSSLNPEPSIYYMLGYAYYEVDNHEKSLECFEQAYLINPDYRFDLRSPVNSISISDKDLIQELTELSSAKRWLSSYAAVISGGLPQIHQNMKKDRMRQKIMSLIKDAYKDDLLFDQLYMEYASNFRKDYAVSAKRWLSTAIGRRLAGFVPDAIGHEDGDMLLSGGVKVHAEMELVIKLEEAMKASASAAEIISLSMFELMKGIQSELQEQSILNSADIDMLYGSIRRYSKEELLPDIMIGLMDICRYVTDEEIRDSIKFYLSPEGRWFSELSRDAYIKVLGNASKMLGVKIGRVIKKGELQL